MFNKKMIDRTFSGTRSSVVSGREVSHRAVARRAAAEGMVLLKNEGGVLPLAAGSRVALYGSGASQTVKGGTGSGDVNERACVSIYQGMKEAGYVVANEDWWRITMSGMSGRGWPGGMIFWQRARVNRMRPLIFSPFTHLRLLCGLWGKRWKKRMPMWLSIF